ncbi:MAG: hypothetical protein KIH63_002350 [Candidatus Saccharibacteria bacterium]|nr:hypothetical protein [Candidatus Saccharibacteria bacterium]
MADPHEQQPLENRQYSPPQPPMSRRDFLLVLGGGVMGGLGIGMNLPSLMQSHEEAATNGGASAPDATQYPQQPPTSTFEGSNGKEAHSAAEQYDPALREKAREYSDQELIDFAHRTDWFLATPPRAQLSTILGDNRELPDPNTLEDGTHNLRNDYRTAFTNLMAQGDIPVTYDYDPYSEQNLLDTDPDLDDRTLGTNLLGLATAISRYPRNFLGNLTAIFANEDRAIVEDGRGNEKTANTYLSVMNLEGPHRGSLVASIRGLWPAGAFHDIAHEGAHILQTNDFQNSLFESVIAGEPPLGEMLQWLNHNRDQMDENQASLVTELLENCDQDKAFEEEAGAIAATFGRGFVQIPESVDSAGANYLTYLLDKQVAAIEMATRKTGVDMYAFVALNQRFPDIHPSEIEAAIEAEKTATEESTEVMDITSSPEHLSEGSIKLLADAYDSVFQLLLQAESEGQLNPLFRIFDTNKVNPSKVIYLDDSVQRNGEYTHAITVNIDTPAGPELAFTLEFRDLAPETDDVDFRKQYPDLRDGVPVFYTTHIYLSPYEGYYQAYNSFDVEIEDGPSNAEQFVNIRSDSTAQAQNAGYYMAISNLKNIAETQGIDPDTIKQILEPLSDQPVLPVA